jgi:hypothetical protein
MKRNPRDDWTIGDIVSVCGEAGLDCRPSSGETHYVVSHPEIEGMLTIPPGRPGKPIYIMLVVQLAESALELE